MTNAATRMHVALTFIAALLAPASGALGAESESIIAVWKPQRLDFEYRADSTFYTCGALQDKLEAILQTLGARGDLRVTRYVCDEQIGLANVQILFSSPVEATAYNIRELTTFDARDALIARVRGARLAAPEDVPRFPAVWRTVSFARERSLGLQAADCELMKQVRRQVLAQMSVRVIADHLRCSPGSLSAGRPRLTVAALVPAQGIAAD